jgi:hypothetical protein
MKRKGFDFKSNFNSGQVRLVENTSSTEGPSVSATNACSDVLKDIADTSGLPPAMNNLIRKISTILDECVYRPSVIEDGGARVPYFQYVPGVEHERKEFVKAIKVLQDLHEQQVDESLDLRGENKVIAEASAELSAKCQESTANLRFLKHQCMGAKRRLAALRDANDRQIREQEGVREQIDAEKQNIWLCQQDTMRKKIQKKSIALQVEAHLAAEKQGLVPSVAVERMQTQVEEQELANIDEKVRFETTLTETFELLEDIRKVQNERKRVMVEVDALGARHEEFERCHTPRPSFRAKRRGVGMVPGGFSLDDGDENENEGGGKASTVGKVDALCAQIEAMRVDTKADQLQQQRQLVTSLRAELQASLSSLKKAMLVRAKAPKAGGAEMETAVAPAASSLVGTTENGSKYFIGKGSGADVPRYLRTDPRSQEVIPFRGLDLHELRKTVRDVWQQKRVYEQANPVESDQVQASVGGAMILRDFMYLYLQRKYGIHKVIVRWGYTITYAVLNFRWDEEIDLFYQILAGQLPTAVYEQQEELVRQLHSFLRRMSRMLISSGAAGGAAGGAAEADKAKDVMMTRGDITFCMSNFFPAKDAAGMKELLGALDVAVAANGDGNGVADASSDTQQTPAALAAPAGDGAVVNLDMLLMTVGVWEGDRERGTFSKADGHVMAGGDRGGRGQGRDVRGKADGKGGRNDAGQGREKALALEEWKAGERSEFQRVLRTQHQREVQALLTEVEDRLTVTAAPGLRVTVAALYEICCRISADVTIGGLCSAVAGLELELSKDVPEGKLPSLSINEKNFHQRAGVLTANINEILTHTKAHGFVDGILNNCHYKQEYRDPEVAANA